MPDALERIEAYFDRVPRATARAETVGPFTLFVRAAGIPFYARPGAGRTGPLTPDQVTKVRDRQRQLGVPEAFEWVDECCPDLADVARRAGLVVKRHPLMVLREWVEAPVPAGYRIRVLTADDPNLPAARATVSVGFATPGTAVGDAGRSERDAGIESVDSLATVRALISDGLFFLAAAEDSAGPVSGGAHQPRGDVTEITGVATLPRFRRRGLGAAVTSALVGEALGHGVTLCFLSADSEDVARVYERVGFSPIATACTAEPQG